MPASRLAGSGRVQMTLAVKRLIRDVALRVPELSHVRAASVLVVAGEARGVSRATIRPGNVGPARGEGPRRFIRVGGRRMLYVMTLRPLWFAASVPEERIGTVFHELYHASASFDGKLHRGRRHAVLPRPAFDREVHELLERYLACAPAEVVEPFGREGIAEVLLWLRLPRASEGDASLDVDQHLIRGWMPMSPPARRRSGSGSSGRPPLP